MANSHLGRVKLAVGGALLLLLAVAVPASAGIRLP
jgi:hypothetical protein